MGLYVPWGQVWNTVRPLILRYWVADPQARFVKFADANYYLPARAELGTIMSTVQIPALGAAGEAFDCDDYAFLMKGTASVAARQRLGISAGLCLGIAWGRFNWLSDPFHACNWVLDDTMVLSWLEPQAKKLYPVDSCMGGLVLLLA